MICPECKVEFKGGKFWVKGVRGEMRRCPNDHRFKPEPKPRVNRDKEDAARWRCVRNHMSKVGSVLDPNAVRDLWGMGVLEGTSPEDAVDGAIQRESKT